MKRHWRKTTPFFLAMILTVSVVLSGCSGSNNDPEQSTDATTNQPEETQSGSDVTLPDSADLPYNPVKTITTYACDSGSPLPNGETLEDNVFTRWSEETLGIKTEYLWVAPTQDDACTNKMRLEIAAGNNLPDIISSYDYKLLEDFVATGQFQEIQPNFDKYASDTFKLGYEQHPEVWNVGKIDGKQMILPFIEAAYQNDPVLWIRKDWMDKLGLEPPKTMSDLEAMMEVFKNSDPDGNGKNDTIPLALSLKEYFSNMMGDAEWILGNYGALSGYGTAQGVWLEKDGKLVNADLQPEVKEGLSKIKEWMDLGYIDQEVAMQNTFDAGTLFTSGKAAIIPAAFWVPRWPFSTDFTDPTAEYEAYPLPTADDGTSMHLTTSIANGGFIINKNFKDLDVLYTLLNRVYEYADPKPGSEFEYGFAEGYDYKLNEDGTVSYDLEEAFEPISYNGIIPKPQMPDLELSFYSQYVHGEVEPSNLREQQWVSDEVTLQAGAAAYDQKDSSVQSAYNGPDTQTMKDKGELLKKIVMDAYIKIIYGEKPLDYFDEMVEQYNKQGGTQLEQEVNEWYSANK
ncbi:extracellular solute-binding protein [Paenibacillus sp. HB172176]|uniref:extracellular solute-binding protein n=1 Tax=Paenibacillus sp. HB172176 TaxID=2493690 RepID=UPI00143ACB47|nr:extracellular solute-binding protein [Paenibacillus sp. HB172176]